MAIQQNRRGANVALIKGEAAMRQAGSGSFVDYGKLISKPLEAMQKAAEKGRAIKEIANQKVAAYLRTMKSGVDVTGLNEEDQKALNQKLMEEKNRYATAASAIVGMEVGSPEYMEQLDIMNNVNNTFVNLKKNKDAYVEYQENYLKDSENHDFSDGTSPEIFAQNSNVVTGDRQLGFGAGGSFLFTQPDGSTVNFKDMNPPIKKAVGAAKEISEYKTAVGNSGVWNKNKEDEVYDQLNLMFTENPDAFRSLAKDKLVRGMDINVADESLIYDPSKVKEFQETIIPQMMVSFQQAAARGKAEKDKDNPTAVSRKARLDAAFANKSNYALPGGTLKLQFVETKPLSDALGWVEMEDGTYFRVLGKSNMPDPQVKTTADVYQFFDAY